SRRRHTRSKRDWSSDVCSSDLEQARQSGCFAVAMDVDAAGLPFLKNRNPPAGSKSVEELREIVGILNKPFIVKGIMTVKSALKSEERRVGKECRSRQGERQYSKEKISASRDGQ